MSDEGRSPGEGAERPRADGPGRPRPGVSGAALRRALAGPAVLTVFALLVVPLAAGRLHGALFTPLALPGYLLMTAGSAVGNALFSNLALWVFWVPFVLGCYVLAVAVGAGYRALRRRV